MAQKRFVAFRLEEEIYQKLKAEHPNISEIVRAFVVCGFYQIQVPHYEELLLIEKLQNDFRKAAINLNQAVRALHSELLNDEKITPTTQQKLQRAADEIHFYRARITDLIGRYYGK